MKDTVNDTVTVVIRRQVAFWLESHLQAHDIELEWVRMEGTADMELTMKLCTEAQEGIASALDGGNR